MRNIWKTVSDSQTISIKQNSRLYGIMHPEKFQPDQIQNGHLADIINLIYVIYMANCVK